MAVISLSVLYSGPYTTGYAVSVPAHGLLLAFHMQNHSAYPVITINGAAMSLWASSSGVFASRDSAYLRAYQMQVTPGTYTFYCTNGTWVDQSIGLIHASLSPGVNTNNIQTSGTNSAAITPETGDTLIACLGLNTMLGGSIAVPAGWTNQFSYSRTGSGGDWTQAIRCAAKQNTGFSAQTVAFSHHEGARALVLGELMLYGKTFDVVPVAIG